MKTVVVACGGGIATSTVIVDKVDKLLKEHKIEHKLIQCTINEIRNYPNADLIVAATPIQDTSDIPKVTATSYLIGMGVEQTNEKILEALKD